MMHVMHVNLAVYVKRRVPAGDLFSRQQATTQKRKEADIKTS